MREARKHGVRVLAVDSEHSAIFPMPGWQAARFGARAVADGLGGPFRDQKHAEGKFCPEITVERALKHPSWVMGRKITIDSATLFNKGWK
jgi:1-deoxy-D-xylulose-5-phosphate reductoisomerase